MKDLKDRSTPVLAKEHGNLKETYRKCEEDFGPNINDNGKKALKGIEDAITAIEDEILSRSKTPSNSNPPQNSP